MNVSAGLVNAHFSPGAGSTGNFSKKPTVHHVNSLTGKQDPAMREKFREVEMWETYLYNNKNELARISKVISAHKEKQGGLTHAGATHIAKTQNHDLEREYQKLLLKTEPIEKLLNANKEKNYRLGLDLDEITQKLLKEQEKNRDLKNKLDVLGDFDVEELKKELERAQKSEKQLEANLKIMCENPWFTTNQTQANVAQKLRVRRVT